MRAGQRLIGRTFAAALASAGLVLSLHVSPVLAQTTITRTSSFAYHAVTGLLTEEKIEPDAPSLCVNTVYTHDTYGNRATQTVSNCTGAVAPATFTTRTAATSTFSTFTISLANAVGTAVNVAVPTGAYARTTANALLTQTEVRTVDPRFGVATALTGPNGLTTQWRVDDFGRKERETRSDGTYTEFFYCIVGSGLDTSSNSTGCGGLAAVAVPADAVQFVHSQPRDTANQVNGPFTRVFVDRAGRQIRAVTQSFNGSSQAVGLIIKDVIYNEHGAKIVETHPYFSGNGSSVTTGGAFGRTLTQYDVLGRPTDIYVSDPAASNTVAQPAVPAALLNGRFIDTTGTAARTRHAYSVLTTTVTDPAGHTLRTEHDPAGQVVRTTDHLGAQVAYRFDAYGNLLETKDGLNNVTTATFDTRGRRLTMVDRNSGDWRYTYNAIGELVRQESPKQRALGQATTMTYDVLGRMINRSTAEFGTTWSYDRYANAAVCNKGIGKLCEVTTTHGVNRRNTFDSLGRPTQTSATFSGAISGTARTYTSSVTYDSVKGRVTSQTYPTGVRVNYGYTPTLGFLEQLTNNSGGALLWRAQRISAWGRVERQLAGNNVQTRSLFQATTGRVAEITAGIGTATNVLNHRYGWDALGNLSSRQDLNGDGGISGQVTETFTYDVINRLTLYAISGNAVTGGTRTVGVAYNSAGNILYKSDVGTYRYPVNGQPRPHGVLEVRPLNGGSIAYSYDANGNVSATTSTSTQPGYGTKYTNLTYTSFNQPDSSGGVLGANGTRYTWAYDDNHARVKEVRVSAAGTRTTWTLHPDKANGLSFEQTIAEDSSIKNRHFLTAAGVVIGVLVTDGIHTVAAATVITKTEYWHKDHLGSSGALTNASGAVFQRYAFDPWGKRRLPNGNYDPTGTLIGDIPAGSDRGFTGHEHLDDVGIIHMNGRLYDPRTGRFLQVDPVVEEILLFQTFNGYSYLSNNPLNSIDPSGYFSLRKIFKALLHFHRRPSLNSLHKLIHADPGVQITDDLVRRYPVVGSVISVAATAAVAIVCAPCSIAVAGAVSAMTVYAQGGEPRDYWRAGLISAGTAAAFYGVGQSTHNAHWSVQIVAHAAVGCGMSVGSGGDCATGAFSAAAGKAVTLAGVAGFGKGTWSFDQHAIVFGATTIVGGTASLIGGGKFANGAVTAAFGYLLNQLAPKDDKVCIDGGGCFDRGVCAGQRCTTVSVTLEISKITGASEIQWLPVNWDDILAWDLSEAPSVPKYMKALGIEFKFATQQGIELFEHRIGYQYSMITTDGLVIIESKVLGNVMQNRWEWRATDFSRRPTAPAAQMCLGAGYTCSAVRLSR